MAAVSPVVRARSSIDALNYAIEELGHSRAELAESLLQYRMQYLYFMSAICIGYRRHGCSNSKRRRSVAAIVGSGIRATV
jgi:hypothetical protein